MNYVYLRVSSHKQCVENQYFDIAKWCKMRGISIDKVIKESISGSVSVDSRKLGGLIRNANKSDCIIIAEISRLGRSILQIMSVLNECMERGIVIYSIKENYELGDNLNAKVLAFAFGLSAEIERYLISQRTKEALERIRSEGKILGRPRGIASLQSLKLYKHKDFILSSRLKSIPIVHIAKALRVNRKTISCFLQRLESGT